MKVGSAVGRKWECVYKERNGFIERWGGGGGGKKKG